MLFHCPYTELTLVKQTRLESIGTSLEVQENTIPAPVMSPESPHPIENRLDLNISKRRIWT